MCQKFCLGRWVTRLKTVRKFGLQPVTPHRSQENAFLQLCNRRSIWESTEVLGNNWRVSMQNALSSLTIPGLRPTTQQLHMSSLGLLSTSSFGWEEGREGNQEPAAHSRMARRWRSTRRSCGHLERLNIFIYGNGVYMLWDMQNITALLLLLQEFERKSHGNRILINAVCLWLVLFAVVCLLAASSLWLCIPYAVPTTTTKKIP